jgi:chaperonin GroES
MQPRNQNSIIIKEIKKEERTEAGLLLLEGTIEKPKEGIVVSKGSNVSFVKEGDIVQFPKMNGKKIDHEGKEYIILSSRTLLAKNPPASIINEHYILVQIHKQLQKEKREMLTEKLFAAPQFIYMTRNLQVGPALQIGKEAAANFPEMKQGDLIVFHHTIEEDSWRLLRKDPDGNELRLVDNAKENMNLEVFGIINDDGTVLPDEDWIFLFTNLERFNPPTSTLEIFENTDDESLRAKLDELEMELKKIKANLDNKELKFKKGEDPTRQQQQKAEDIHKYMEDLQQQKFDITKHLNSKKLMIASIAFINPRTINSLDNAINSNSSLLVDKSILYPLDIMGSRYFLIHKSEVIATL